MTSKRRPRENLRFLNIHLEPDRQLRAIIKMLRYYSDESDRLEAALQTAEVEYAQAGEDELSGASRKLSRLSGESIYDDAAYSMGAVGMLAPFVEAIFYQSFVAISEKFRSAPTVFPHKRWKAAKAIRWDCHFVVPKKGKPRKNLVEGILQISDALRLMPKFPDDLEQRLDALFSYRNKMFHHGLEWPAREQKAFDKYINSKQWPKTWFRWSDEDGEPAIFYLSSEFIFDAVAMIDEILDGLGSFVLEWKKEINIPVVEVKRRIKE
jgi:hypothetical protein